MEIIKHILKFILYIGLLIGVMTLTYFSVVERYWVCVFLLAIIDGVIAIMTFIYFIENFIL